MAERTEKNNFSKSSENVSFERIYSILIRMNDEIKGLSVRIKALENLISERNGK